MGAADPGALLAVCHGHAVHSRASVGESIWNDMDPVYIYIYITYLFRSVSINVCIYIYIIRLLTDMTDMDNVMHLHGYLDGSLDVCGFHKFHTLITLVLTFLLGRRWSFQAPLLERSNVG